MGEDCGALRCIDKLRLNDASLTYEPENSVALGFDSDAVSRHLHMEINQERLEREYNLDLLVTSPSVEYRLHD